MAAGFSITIRAQDYASTKIDNLNRKIAEARAPADRLQKSLATFSRLSGVGKVAEGFQRMARGAFSAFQSIARVVAPLSAITGAASVAGMYRMVEAWGQWGSRLGFAAQRIGLTASQLQTFQGAGLLAGTSMQGMTNGLQALGQSMYEAVGGRAPETVALFNQLGIAFDDGTKHARSVAAVLPQLADKIASIKDPYTQARVAAQLFGGAAEDMLPFLRLGSHGIEELTERSRRYGVINEAGIDAANRMREAQAGVTLAVTGLTNSIAERLSPILTPLLNQLADWIGLHRQLISNWIGDRVQELATYLQHIDFGNMLRGVTDLISSANHLANAFGGWKIVLEGIFALKAASLLFGMLGGVNALSLAVVGLTAAYIANDAAYENFIAKRKGLQSAAEEKAWIQGRVRSMTPEKRAEFEREQASHGGTVMSGGLDAKQAKSFFMGAGWTAAQAAGLNANIQSESGFNPFAKGDRGAAFGLGQWHADRQADYAKRYGHTMQSVENQSKAMAEQLDFYNYELTQGKERGAGARLRASTTAYDAGSIVSRYDERPAAADEAADNRGHLAQKMALADGTPGATGASGKVDVHIKTSGPGVQQVVAKSTGNVNPPKVATSGVGASPT